MISVNSWSSSEPGSPRGAVGCNRSAWVRVALIGGLLGGVTPQTTLAQTTASVAGPAPTLATIAGVTFDSLEGRPVAGARVRVVRADEPGEGWSVTSDAEGGFRVGVPDRGSYLATFFHPRLDSLGVAPSVVAVGVREPGEIRIVLATPSPKSFANSVCGARAALDSTGVIVGFLRAPSASTLAAVQVVARWPEATLGKGGLEYREQTTHGTVRDDGRYEVCHVPLGTRVALRATGPAGSTGSVLSEVPADGFVRVDLVLGDQALVGQLRAHATLPDGSNAVGVRVRVDGSDWEGRTGEDGWVGGSGLPTGSRMVEFLKIGFEPVLSRVNVGVDQTVSVRFEQYAVSLDTVKVVSERLRTNPEYRAHLQRVKVGSGHFLNAEEMDARALGRVTSALGSVPDVALRESGGDVQVHVATAGRSCNTLVPIFVDGIRITGALDWFVRPGDVAAAEIYTSPNEVPGSFQVTNACGALVIWTKRHWLAVK